MIFPEKLLEIAFQYLHKFDVPRKICYKVKEDVGIEQFCNTKQPDIATVISFGD